VLVGSVDGRIYRDGPIDQPGGARFGQKPGMYPVPRPVGRVTAVPLPNRLPRTELRRKIPPGDAAAVAINDAFNDLAVAPERPPTPPVRTRQQRLDPGPLIITQNRRSRHRSSISASRPLI
jgi:hypothetical protein